MSDKTQWLNVSNISVKNAKNELLMPDFDKISKYIGDEKLCSTIMDKSLCRVLLTFELHGPPPEIGNALVRASTTEQAGIALDVKYESVHTDDDLIEINSLVDNIKHLPLRYGLAEEDIDNMILHLELSNKTFDSIPVMSGDIKVSVGSGGKIERPIMYSSIQLTTLNRGKSIQIDHIEITKGSGFAPGSSSETAKFYPAHAYSIIPLDRNTKDIPKNFSYSDTTANTTPLIHRIRCEMGCVSPDSNGLLNLLYYNGCVSIIERLKVIKYIIDNRITAYYTESSDKCILVIQETNTIAKILDRVAISLYPDISAITAESRYPDEIMTVTISDHRNREIFISTVNKCIEIYTHLSGVFSNLDVSYV